MEGVGVRWRKGRRDQESQIETGDVGEKRIKRGAERETHTGIKREAKKKR